MKVVAETKFNIGDEVYSLEYYDVYWANPTPYIVTDIFVKVARNMHTAITYRITQNELTDTITERFLFATYEECKQWCYKQNKEE